DLHLEPSSRRTAMPSRIVGLSLMVMGVAMLAGSLPAADDEKPKSGTIVGQLKSQTNTPEGKNTIIEVLAPGEEKARKYFVQFDPKIKGPIESVLKDVRAAK